MKTRNLFFVSFLLLTASFYVQAETVWCEWDSISPHTALNKICSDKCTNQQYIPSYLDKGSATIQKSDETWNCNWTFFKDVVSQKIKGSGSMEKL